MQGGEEPGCFRFELFDRKPSGAHGAYADSVISHGKLPENRLER